MNCTGEGLGRSSGMLCAQQPHRASFSGLKLAKFCSPRACLVILHGTWRLFRLSRTYSGMRPVSEARVGEACRRVDGIGPRCSGWLI